MMDVYLVACVGLERTRYYATDDPDGLRAHVENVALLPFGPARVGEGNNTYPSVRAAIDVLTVVHRVTLPGVPIWWSTTTHPPALLGQVVRWLPPHKG